MYFLTVAGPGNDNKKLPFWNKNSKIAKSPKKSAILDFLSQIREVQQNQNLCEKLKC